MGRSLSERTAKGQTIKLKYARLYNIFAYSLCFGSGFDKSKIKSLGRAWNFHVLLKKFGVICFLKIPQGPGNPGVLKSECMFNYHVGQVIYISIKKLALIFNQDELSTLIINT